MQIVRVKETTDYPSGQLVRVYLMTREEYLKLTIFITYGHRYTPHPYKWWQLQRFILVTAYLFSRFLRNKPNAIPTKALTKSSIVPGVIIGLIVLLIGHYVFHIG